MWHEGILASASTIVPTFAEKHHTVCMFTENVTRRYSRRSITSLKKRKFVVMHTICRTEDPAVPDSWVTITPSVKILCPQKILLFSYKQ